MKALHLIGMISGIALFCFGAIHLFLLEKLFYGKPNYLMMKKWAGKITLALTIIFFGTGVLIMIKLLLK